MSIYIEVLHSTRSVGDSSQKRKNIKVKNNIKRKKEIYNYQLSKEKYHFKYNNNQVDIAYLK